MISYAEQVAYIQRLRSNLWRQGLCTDAELAQEVALCNAILATLTQALADTMAKRQRVCDAKVAHRTPEAAQCWPTYAVDELLYHCGTCGFWHYGSAEEATDGALYEPE